MPRALMIICFLISAAHDMDVCAQETNYIKYHRQIDLAEEKIARENYDDAIKTYGKVFNDFSFVFVRDCKIAAQLCSYQGQVDLAFEYLRRGALAGWELKDMRKNVLVKRMANLSQWQVFEEEYPQLREEYESSLNLELRARVKKMFSKDQKKAMGALFRIGSKSQDKYAENKFAPQSEQQMKELQEIFLEIGYPGEQLVGNDFWISTIMSHHNSISQEYNKKDSLYPRLKPLLMNALAQGEVSPFELALIDEWHRSTLGQGSYVGYGILDPPSKSALKETNNLRADFFLRSVETRNGLVDIQDKTQMDFYLPGEGWIDGKIEVVPD